VGPRQIKRVRRSIWNGNKQFILSNTTTGKERVNADLLRLRLAKEELSRQFCEQRSIWTSGPVLEGARPAALTDQIRIATLAFLGALTINLIEVLVAGWISGWGLVPILLAILLPISIKTVLVTLWRNEDQPQETVRKIKIFVLAPSLILFLLAAILLLLVRVLPDEMALKLDMVFSVSILALGIGCLAAAAGLFALAHIYYWSKSSERAYRTLEIEDINTKELLKLIETTEISVRASLQSPQHSPPPAAHSQSLAKSASLAVIALLLSINAACTPESSSTAGPVKSHLETAVVLAGDPAYNEAPESDLRIFFDATNSQSQESYKIVIDSLVRQLPKIIEKNHVLRLAVYVFTQSGWEARSIFDSILPELKQPKMLPSRRDELELLRGRKNRVAEEQTQERYRQLIDQTMVQYHNELNAVLAGFPQMTLLAAVGNNAFCTDLNGTLARIGNIDASNRRQLIFLITDGAETCTHELESVARPHGDVRLAIILTTEKSEKSAHLIFSDHRTQLQKAAPWAVIGAYHNEDFNSLFSKTSLPETTESLPATRNIKAFINR
jgi:hypothetical protein